jgi:hypothetical protein
MSNKKYEAFIQTITTIPTEAKETVNECCNDEMFKKLFDSTFSSAELNKEEQKPNLQSLVDILISLPRERNDIVSDFLFLLSESNLVNHDESSFLTDCSEYFAGMFDESPEYAVFSIASEFEKIKK